MPNRNTVLPLISRSSHGTHLLDHLAANGAGFTGGQVAVVALLQVNAHLLGSLHFELVHRFTSLGNIDLIAVLYSGFSPFSLLCGFLSAVIVLPDIAGKCGVFCGKGGDGWK